nr:PREDICTED: receptor-type guanylate cyclase Gyc76C-like isoform X1 [Bemisia tabaci]
MRRVLAVMLCVSILLGRPLAPVSAAADTSPAPAAAAAIAPALAHQHQNATNTTSNATAAATTTTTTNLTVGYLTDVKGSKGRQGLTISGALTLALHEINEDPSILPNVTLVPRYVDTRGDTVKATEHMVDMLCEGVSAFFGPEGSCYVEAIVAQSKNIPMISYKCSEYSASLVPTFARTEPPDTQVTKSVISLLKYYDWKKFSILYEESWTPVAESLKAAMPKNNLTYNHYKLVVDRHKCCEEQKPCCNQVFWHKEVEEMRNKTRIFVFLGATDNLIDMMATMQALQMFENGEYMVIYVDMNTYSLKDAHKYLWTFNQLDEKKTCSEPGFEKWGKSLLVIVLSEPVQSYENFTQKVRQYNLLPPFNFVTPPIFDRSSYIKFVTVYAAYLYDSVKLYAHALDSLLRQEPVLNPDVIKKVASNGTRIIETIITKEHYQSITGATIRLDKNGDSEGNFSVLALKPHRFSEKNFSCGHFMVPVGQFYSGNINSSLPEYRLIKPDFKPDWPGGIKPFDEPSCGFDNERCLQDNSHQSALIVAGTLGVLLFCAMVITLSIYRKWKIEQEIEGLLWKIDPSDLTGYYGNDIVSSPSKLSLVSATSYESRCGPQVFAATGQFRNMLVRIKELKFSRKKDISRETMKEMRMLRDLRHDNVNSFIGASVEPLRILIVTDYCAKGSLYDIVENEDIKLDKMFIAFLVHDLIKGMIFLHNSPLMCHGNLKSSNCVVTSRWVLQVTDFGLHELRHGAENDSIGEHQYYRSLFWKAPELLRDIHAPIRGTQKADVYAFAIILYEIIGRRGPFGACGVDEPKEIVSKVKRVPEPGEAPFRPNLDLLVDCEAGAEFVLQTIQDCWAEQPELRPDFISIRSRLKNMKQGKQRNIVDQMMVMMEKYTNNLEDLVNQRTLEVFEEKRKTEDLLHRMLPTPVASRLTRGEGVEPEQYDLVTIYFSDIVGFTAMSAKSSPLQVVNFLNDLYTLFDQIIRGFDVYKVETIGDAYMVVSGLPERNNNNHAGEIASMSLDLLEAVKNHHVAHKLDDALMLRIGVHTGPVVAGVVGLTMPRYCLFGDTVNTASRMESTGEPLKIHISAACKEVLDKLGGYIIEERGLVKMKGKGEVLTFWLVGATDTAVKRREVDLAALPPPLFCRPAARRSPKLLGGLESRRHSSVPRVPTSTEPQPTNQLRQRISESYSMDPLPDKQLDSQSVSLIQRSCRSLQESQSHCLENCGAVLNGTLHSVPLLTEQKRWHSLEDIQVKRNSKLISIGSLRSRWFFKFFNNASYRNSDVSLRKTAGYTDLQLERESIV